jgi:3-hydroxyisobutyrate dehydrogenase-like beta-hydroxyacid dehydrogenase
MTTAKPCQAIGMIGLGHMGGAVALRLLDGGFPVVVFNRNPAAAEPLKSHGAVVAPTLRDLAGRVDVVITFLPDDRAVREVYTDPMASSPAPRREFVFWK